MKTAIVTGASGKIGGGIVKKLVSDGFIVFAQYNKNFAAIQNLINDIANNGEIIPIKFDNRSSEEIRLAYKQIAKKTKVVDVLVNCAGASMYKLAQDTTYEEFSDLLSVNVAGAHLLTSLVLNGMISNKSGKIINVSSIWGNVGASMEVAYSATKAALIGYTKALAKEVGYSGINVNCICPGVIDTPMNSRFSADEIQELIDATPIGRLGKDTDVSELVSFLASEKSDFITGQIITVDGGFTL